MERYDIAVIGTGPAGVSAAITAKVRGKKLILFGSRHLSDKVEKAHSILNYPGLPNVSGAELANAYRMQLDSLTFPSQKSRSRRSTLWATISPSRPRTIWWKAPLSFWPPG